MENKQKSMEEFLKEELEREAEEIIAEVKADESLQNIALPEDMDDKLFEMIRKHEAQKAAYEMLSDEDKEALRIGREMQFLGEDVKSAGNLIGEKVADGAEASGNAGTGTEDSVVPVSTGAESVSAGKVVGFKKKKKKVYLVVAVVAIMTLAVGITSIGGAPFISKIKKQIIGEREMVKVNTDRTDGDAIGSFENSEEAAYQAIDDTLGINVVKLDYKPAGMEFFEYSIDEKLDVACLLYKYNGSIIEYKVSINYEEQSLGYDVEDKLEKDKIIHMNGVDIIVKHYQVQNGKEEYVAQFKYEEVDYVLNASLKEDEFQEIVKNLKFY